jgi:hypothetical protein
MTRWQDCVQACIRGKVCMYTDDAERYHNRYIMQMLIASLKRPRLQSELNTECAPTVAGKQRIVNRALRKLHKGQLRVGNCYRKVLLVLLP